MKQVLILLLCVYLSSSVYSQNANERERYAFAGLRMRLLSDGAYNTHAYTFAEIAVGNLVANKFSFEIRAGMDNYRSINEGYVYMGGAKTTTNTKAVYTASGVFIKPAWVFYKSLGKVLSNYASVSINASYAVHTLEINVDDPVYGRKTSTYQKIAMYPFSAVEFAHTHLLHLGNKVDLNLSYYLGIKTVSPQLFNDVIKGFKNNANFVPGVTYGGYMYANLLLGAHIHLY